MFEAMWLEGLEFASVFFYGMLTSEYAVQLRKRDQLVGREEERNARSKMANQTLQGKGRSKAPKK
jgi:hypothetical protein